MSNSKTDNTKITKKEPTKNETIDSDDNPVGDSGVVSDSNAVGDNGVVVGGGGAPRVLMAKTVNFVHKPFERNQEVKVNERYNILRVNTDLI